MGEGEQFGMRKWERAKWERAKWERAKWERASSSACGDQLLSHKSMRGVGPEDSRWDPSGRGLSGRGLSGRGLSGRGPKPMKRESRAEGSEWDAHE